MTVARGLLAVLCLAALALAGVLFIALRQSQPPKPMERLGLGQPSLGLVLPPLDNLDPVTATPRVTRAEVVGALAASHAQDVHVYLYWNEVQADGPARGETIAEYERTLRKDPAASPTLASFRQLIGAIETQTQAQVMVTLVQKVPCWASSDPNRRSFAPLRSTDGAVLRNQNGDPIRPSVNLRSHQELFWNERARRWDACNPWLPPDAPSLFGNFAQIAASALNDVDVHEYEIGNEPNHSPEDDVVPGGSPVGKYAALLSAATRGVHLAEPGATIIAGAFSGDGAEFLSHLYTKLGPRKALFDAVSVHKYPSTPPQNCQGPLSLCALAQTRAVMNEHGDAAKPIWITELGYSTCSDDKRCVDQSGQAEYLRREEHLLLDGSGKMHSYGVSRLFIYDLHDFGWSKEFGCGGWCNGFWSGIGLLRSDLSPKPAFRVFQKLASALSQSRRGGRQVKR